MSDCPKNVTDQSGESSASQNKSSETIHNATAAPTQTSHNATAVPSQTSHNATAVPSQTSHNATAVPTQTSHNATAVPTQTSHNATAVPTQTSHNATAVPTQTSHNTTAASTRLQNKSRLHQPTAASQARAKPEVISKKPFLPKGNKSAITAKKGPMKPTTQFVDPSRAKVETIKRSQQSTANPQIPVQSTPMNSTVMPTPMNSSIMPTPMNSTMVTKRSTPISDKSSELNLEAWDASVISTVNRTGACNILDETTINPIDQSAMEPQAALFKGADFAGAAKKSDGSKPALMKKPLPQTAIKSKKPPANAALGRVSATASKVQTVKKPVDTNESGGAHEDGEITDEMIDYAYYRYIQSQFIEMKSEQALEETKVQCEKQVFDAWMAYEELAQEVNEKMKRVETWKTLEAMQVSLKVLKEKLQPIVNVMDGVESKFGKINDGLDAVKHNLALQGLSIEDQQIAKEELRNMEELFDKFLEDTEAIDAKVDKDMDKRLEMAQEYSRLASNFAEALRLSDDCRKLLNTAEQVAMQEASLRISMMQLERAENKNKLVDI